MQTDADVTPLVLRLTLGLVIFPLGARKLLGMVIAILVKGSGALSLDRWLTRRSES